MQSPYFFQENLSGENECILGEETSRHIAQVLRMKEDDTIRLTNGKGYTKTASIIIADKKRTVVRINDSVYVYPPSSKVAIAISLIKNINRFEWFLEKAAETGVSVIIPFISSRTEKLHVRHHRMKNILISAMLQSQQSWLPEIYEPLMLKDVLQLPSYANKYIAHCINDDKKMQLSYEVLKKKIQ